MSRINPNKNTPNPAETEALLKAICSNHNGKMELFASLSTSCRENKDCIKRMQTLDKDKAICPNCFSNEMHDHYDALSEKLKRNTTLLTDHIISPEVMPYLNYAYFRFESFGDLNNSIQAINYFNLCYKNKHMSFAQWTKNPWFINLAIKAGYKKPKNINIGYSSPLLNVEVKNITNLYPFIDFVFTVYTARYAIENDIEINCGDRYCIECQKCYKTHKPDTVTYVHEILKEQANVYYKALAIIENGGSKEEALKVIDKWENTKAKREAKKEAKNSK